MIDASNDPNEAFAAGLAMATSATKFAAARFGHSQFEIKLAKIVLDGGSLALISAQF